MNVAVYSNSYLPKSSPLIVIYCSIGERKIIIRIQKIISGSSESEQSYIDVFIAIINE